MNIQPKQIERIRLLMSTYQDGTGQLRVSGSGTLPNWRDFERSAAAALNGYTFENKGFLDVLINGKEVGLENKKIGISCKMRNTLSAFNKTGSVSLELSNAAQKFWDILHKNKIYDMRGLRLVPDRGGKHIIELYESWKYQVTQGEDIDIDDSFYLTCLYDIKKGVYQLFALPFLLPDPETLTWSIRESKPQNENKGTLIGMKDDKVIIEWYGMSGGQLKYYPTKEQIIWHSYSFSLEPLPNIEGGHGLTQKAKAYFTDKWAALI
jgi:hypothetical protein